MSRIQSFSRWGLRNLNNAYQSTGNVGSRNGILSSLSVSKSLQIEPTRIFSLLHFHSFFSGWGDEWPRERPEASLSDAHSGVVINYPGYQLSHHLTTICQPSQLWRDALTMCWPPFTHSHTHNLPFLSKSHDSSSTSVNLLSLPNLLLLFVFLVWN